MFLKPCKQVLNSRWLWQSMLPNSFPSWSVQQFDCLSYRCIKILTKLTPFLGTCVHLYIHSLHNTFTFKFVVFSGWVTTLVTPIATLFTSSVSGAVAYGTATTENVTLILIESCHFRVLKSGESIEQSQSHSQHCHTDEYKY